MSGYPTDEVVASLPKVVAQHAQFLDLWPSTAEPDGELAIAPTTDRLHITAEGYAAGVAELKPALESLFQKPPSSTAIPVQRA